MAKFLADDILNDGLNKLKNTATIAAICINQPLDNAAALGTSCIGTVACASGNFTVGNGDSSGRKITYGPGTVVVGTSGNITHVAWVGAGTLLAVGTCASTAVTAAGTVVINAVDIAEFADIA